MRRLLFLIAGVPLLTTLLCGSILSATPTTTRTVTPTVTQTVGAIGTATKVVTPTVTPTRTPTQTYSEWRVWYKKITGLNTGTVSGEGKFTSVAKPEGMKAIAETTDVKAVETKVAIYKLTPTPTPSKVIIGEVKPK